MLRRLSRKPERNLKRERPRNAKPRLKKRLGNNLLRKRQKLRRLG